MFNEEGKLIVIHQYPTPSLEPFLNPVCKDTYHALPKIYGNLRKKRYLNPSSCSNDLQVHKCIRECCSQKYQQTRSKTDLKTKRKPAINLLVSHNKTRRAESLDGLPKPKEHKKPKGRNLLPALKEFSSGELNEAQTKHKVHRSAGAMSLNVNTFDPSSAQTSKKELRSSHQGHLRSSSISSESVQTQNKYFEFGQKLKENLHRKSRTQVDEGSSARYYEYLQNNQKQQTPREFELQRSNTDKKRSDSRESDSYSISSGAIRQRKESTMFHKVKQKQSGSYLQKKSRINSVYSNGLFKIPQEPQYQDYLLKYKPFNPALDIMNLVRQKNFQIVPSTEKVYFGQIVDQRKHGQGITISQKEIYEGKYENDLKTIGCEKNIDGIYTGEYARGKREGKGKFVWANGEIFQGNWVAGKKNGLGVWKSPKGDYYQGQWRDNRQNGQGFFYHLGGSKYRGEFKDFLKHGKGHEEFPNGDTYTGQYSCGKPHGHGKYVWSNGDCYDGQFSDGSRSGQGVLKQKSGQVYEGGFKNDMKHGTGHQRFKSGESFTGQFFEGQRLYGQLRTAKGDVIEITK